MLQKALRQACGKPVAAFGAPQGVAMRQICRRHRSLTARRML